MAIEKKSLEGAAKAKSKAAENSRIGSEGNAVASARLILTKKLAVAKLATARLSSAKMVLAKKLPG
jgi:hypothetical protein